MSIKVLNTLDLIENSVTATHLNISGNGTAGQLLTSDGDGSFSYTNPQNVGGGVDGTGTQNQLAKWVDSNTITGSAMIADNGSNAVVTDAANIDIMNGSNTLLSVHKDGSAGSNVRFTNTTTAIGGGNGFLVGIDSSERAVLNNIENTDMLIKTNNATRITVKNDGHVVVGDAGALGTISITFNNLPTSDPGAAGRLWNDSGTLKISAG